jgi:hypothetical protein
LPEPQTDDAWHSGYIDLYAGGGSRRLTLRALGASPDRGLMDQLFGAEIIAWKGTTLHVRGIEPVNCDGQAAAMCQEWLIELSPDRAGAPGKVQTFGDSQWRSPDLWDE